jgi:hypothetical protein
VSGRAGRAGEGAGSRAARSEAGRVIRPLLHSPRWAEWVQEHPNSPRVDSTPLPRGKLSPLSSLAATLTERGTFTDSEQCGGRQPCAAADAQESRPEGRAARVEAHAHSRVHAVLNCCVSRWSPRRNQRWDMAERDRLQGRSGRRIRAPKQSGAVSFILFRVRAKVQLVQFRATMTGPPSDARRSEHRQS